MTGALLLVGVLSGAAVALALPPLPVLTGADAVALNEATGAEVGWMMRWRPWLAVFAGVGAALFVGGAAGLVAAPVVAAGCWMGIARAEPPGVRQRREAMQRELPALVRLLGAALAAGASPEEALTAVTDALPGPAADRLATVTARLRLGADPVTTWRGLAAEPALAPLGRAFARAHATGAPVVASVERLGEELARNARAETEDRARAVGVKAAVPLGICLLPAFILLGIVPVVGGPLSGLGL